MRETVETSGLILDVPVVKEIIVKERAAYEAVLVNFDLKCLLEEICYKETELRDRYAVFENSVIRLAKCKANLYLLCFDNIKAVFLHLEQYNAKNAFWDKK